ncbi:hypothetical protein BD310DRAFT_989541 [Dichomitus squalens]|uniref:Uncharacterized protein n=1 Tax=Dichomitus squalens TaxID=114155 RepID=A0A4Q9PJC5_9APHY|nr:hypothetical protein BD310DRAFT_989541 [Dichomitus squalens]
MRINVFVEGSDKVIWYKATKLTCVKERFLTDDEILEHIVDNATSTIVWTVHRPKRGWYIRLRTLSFPPGVFIPLLPLPQTSPYFAEAALSFACRTNLPSPRPPNLTQHSTDSELTLTDGTAPREREREAHSYPPTPPTGPVVVVNPPSPKSVHAKLDSVSLSPPRIARRISQPTVQSAVTHFVVTPRPIAPPAEQGQASIFSRLFAVIKSNAPAHDYSFTLAPIPMPSQTTLSSPSSPALTSPSLSPLAQASGAGPSLGAGPGQTSANPLAPTPLLTFHDRTPVWTARCSSGLIELDEQQCQVLGVDPVFYIAVAMTYLEFLQERESYLVAAYD